MTDAWLLDTEATHLDAVPVSHLMPDDTVVLSSMVGDSYPTRCYLLGLRVAWCTRVDDLFHLHDHMGGTWLLVPGTVVLRVHA